MAGPKGTLESILNQQDSGDTQSGVAVVKSHPNGGDGKTESPQLVQQDGSMPPVTTVPGQAEQMTQTGEPKKMTYVEMLQQMSPYKPPTEEELAKERKRRKTQAIFSAIGDGISAMSNLYFTTQGAPSMFDGRTTLSGTAQKRWDKVDAERKANNEKYVEAYMRAKQADDAVERDERNWKRQIERDRLADQRYEAEQKKENERYEKRMQVEAERWQKTFDENVRQFNVSSQQAAARLKNESARLAREMAKDKVSFALGEGLGSISIPREALNNANISYVFSKLPESVRSQIKGAPIKGKDMTGQKDVIIGYQDPTSEAMLIAIGANIEGNIDAQNALRELAGEEPVPKPKQPTSQRPNYDPEAYDYYSNGQQSIQVPKGAPKPVGYKKPNPMI